MLQQIREGFGKWVFGVIIGLIALSFVFWGVDFNLGVSTWAAKVNGEEVSLTEFQRQYQDQQQRFAQLYRAELTEEVRNQIRNDVLQGLVQQEALQQRVQAAGYRISDQRLTDFIRDIPNFQVDGEFSVDAYRGLLSTQALSPAGFERLQRENLEIGELQGGVAVSTFYTPAEFRRYIELINERREVAFARFQAESFSSEVQLSEEAIRAYYDDNPNLFMTEEEVDIQYIRLREVDIAADVEVDEARLLRYYEDNVDLYQTEEERRPRHILFTGDDGEQRANAALERINAGEDFAALAEELSDDAGTKGSGGDLGWVSRGLLVGPFEEALFNMSLEEVAGPVESEFGWHLIRLEGINEPTVQAFETVRDQLAEDSRQQAAADRFDDEGNRLADAAFDALTELESVAQATGLPLQELSGLTRAGGVPEFPASDPIVAAAFSIEVLEDGENSPLIDLGGGEAVVLRVKEHRLPQAKPFEEVKDSIREQLMQAQAADLAQAAGEAFLDDYQAAADQGSVVGASNGEWNGPSWMSRETQDNPEIARAAFDMPKPTPGNPTTEGVRLFNGDFAAIVLSRIEPGSPQAISREERDARKEQLAAQAAMFEFGAYVGEVSSAAKVIIPQDVAEGNL